MIRTSLFLSVAYVAVALAAAPVLAAPKVQLSTRRKTVEIRDDAWGIVAFRMQVPEDWKFEGVLLRDANCDMLPAVAYRLSSPDGLTGYQVLPQLGSHWSDDATNLRIYRNAHCKTMEVLTPAEYLAYVLPAIRPNPIAGAIQPTGDAAQLDASIAAYNQRSAAAHLPGRESGGGVHSRIAYTLRGQAIEENLRVVVATFDTQIGSPRQPRHAWSTIVDVSGLRAPKGQLDDVMAALAPMLQTATYTPEWQQRMAAKQAKDQATALAHIKAVGDATSAMLARNHAAYMQQSHASFEHAQQAERDREDAVHRSAVAWTLYAGDEQLVRNPQTGGVSRVTTKNGSNGYQDASGDIVMSKDPNFDPNFYLRGTWTQLENVDPLKP